ncbi:MAG: YfhO family protein [Eubacterium sp.]|nr:YfhO family protein [Eubacterium sp.]
MYKSELKYYRKAFFTAAIMAIILITPFVIADGGYFIYYGDYNAQQIPFYTLCNQAIRNGEIMWNWQTDLGANFIGSYSFYTIGSPFFWLTLPFPPEFAKYLMAPIIVLKISCCSVFAFAYIRRFVGKPQSALIGGLLYAFSGFSMYNIFFNHFHEAMVVFPLMLIALEEAVVNKRRVFFALTVALNAFVNYFFFAGECVFLIIYFLCRCTDKSFPVTVKTFFALAFESVVGLMLAGVMFLPAIIACLDVPRTDNIINGWNMVFHNPSQRYGLIFQSLFFPADIPARQNFFPDSSARWSSVSAYLPLFSMSGVISFIKFKKRHWAKYLMPLMLLFALIPVLNSSFVMFNTSYYTRWFYMPILVACYMTAYALEHEEIDMRYGLKWCGFAVVLISLVGVLPSEVTKTVTDSDTGAESKIKVTELFSLPNEKIPFWMSVGLAIVAIIICYILIRSRKRVSTQRFLKTSFAFTVVACMLFSFYTIGYGRSIGPSLGDYNSIVDAEFDLPDPNNGDFYRVEAYGMTNNANMLWNNYGFRSFHSILPGSTFEFYDSADFSRSVNTDPDGTYYPLRSLTSTKYLIMQTYKTEYKDTTVLLQNMANFEKIGEQGSFTIYENKAFIPMGYTCDLYITDDDFDYTTKSSRDSVYVKGVLLNEEQIEKYGDILTHIESKEVNRVTYDRFEEDCKKLAAVCVDTFVPVKNGFIATSSFETDRFTVFSVPWESGWSATINGQPAEVEKVNHGFLGIRVPAGECTIEFSYVTPGLKAGIIISIIAAVLLLGYFAMLKLVFKYKPLKYKHLYNEQQLGKIKLHSAYINTVFDEAEIPLIMNKTVSDNADGTENETSDADADEEKSTETIDTDSERNEN